MKKNKGNYKSKYRLAFGDKGQSYTLAAGPEELGTIAGLMKNIIYSNEIPYIKHPDGNANRFSQTFLGAMMDDISKLASMYDGDLVYSPEIQLFFNVYRSHPIKYLSGECRRGLNHEIITNEFADDLRKKALHENIKEKTKSWRRNFLENKKRIENYVSTLHNHYAHLMAINLVFRYHKSTIKDKSEGIIASSTLINRQRKQRMAFMGMNIEDTNDTTPEPPYRVGYCEISKDWERFRINMRGKPSIFRHLVGYISRFYFTSHGGYHLELAVLFDGSKTNVDQRLGDQIGNYWTNITGRRGYSARCDPVKYAPQEVGMDSYSREEKRAFLLDALDYFIRDFELAKVRTVTGTKLLRTGKLPKICKRVESRAKNTGMNVSAQ